MNNESINTVIRLKPDKRSSTQLVRYYAWLATGNRRHTRNGTNPGIARSNIQGKLIGRPMGDEISRQQPTWL